MGGVAAGREREGETIHVPADLLWLQEKKKVSFEFSSKSRKVKFIGLLKLFSYERFPPYGIHFIKLIKIITFWSLEYHLFPSLSLFAVLKLSIRCILP